MYQCDRTNAAVSRRQVLVGTGMGALAVAGAAVLPSAAQADESEAMKYQKKLIGDKAPKQGKVSLKLPEIAENGNTVPMTVAVESPMSDDDYVKEVHVMAMGNPGPGVASFHFTPMSGKAEVSTRVRLAKTQDVKALAVMNNGDVYEAAQQVKVTIGGCGG